MGLRKGILISCIYILSVSIHGDASIGVNNGMAGNNLPSQGEVVDLMKNYNIGKYRIFKEEKTVLEAFANSEIELTVGVANDKLQSMATDQNEADQWVNQYIKPYYPATNIKYIAVGNEVLGKKYNGQSLGQFLVGAMNNIQTALQNANVQGNIKISTTHAATSIIDDLAPRAPSKGSFLDEVQNDMKSVLQFLSTHDSPFMANVYPYFTYDTNPDAYNKDMDYALFKSTANPVMDGSLKYTNLFDAIVDTIYYSMEAMGYPNIPIIVTESGWPSYGTGNKTYIANMDNAMTYNNNLINHVLSNTGTPKKQGMSIETYIFALFNENLKGESWDYETEKNYGLFYPNKTPVYPVNFSP